MVTGLCFDFVKEAWSCEISSTSLTHSLVGKFPTHYFPEVYICSSRYRRLALFRVRECLSRMAIKNENWRKTTLLTQVLNLLLRRNAAGIIELPWSLWDFYILLPGSCRWHLFHLTLDMAWCVATKIFNFITLHLKIVDRHPQPIPV